MEGVSASVYKRMRSYWRRRGYERINGPGRRRHSTVELGESAAAGGRRRRRRRLWRMRIKPKLKLFKLASPKKFLVWLRDAYVNMMLRLADSRMVASAGYGPYGAPMGGQHVASFGGGPRKEHDEKMIMEIYNSLVMAQGQLVPRVAAKCGPIAAAAAAAATNNKLTAIAE